MSSLDRLNRTLIFIFQILLVAIGLITLYTGRTTGNYENLLPVIPTFILTFLPTFVRSKANFKVPPEAWLLGLTFAFAANFLGEVLGFYELFEWWDLVLHFVSGLIIGYLSFSVVFLFLDKTFKEVTVDYHKHAFIICFFAVTLSFSIIVVWEIFEFAMDEFFGTNMQVRESGVTNTMLDMIFASFATLFSALSMYIFLKRNKGKGSILQRIVIKLIEVNTTREENQD